METGKDFMMGKTGTLKRSGPQVRRAKQKWLYFVPYKKYVGGE
jgi:hypothetical protein